MWRRLRTVDDDDNEQEEEERTRMMRTTSNRRRVAYISSRKHSGKPRSRQANEMPANAPAASDTV